MMHLHIDNFHGDWFTWHWKQPLKCLASLKDDAEKLTLIPPSNEHVPVMSSYWMKYEKIEIKDANNLQDKKKIAIIL